MVRLCTPTSTFEQIAKTLKGAIREPNLPIVDTSEANIPKSTHYRAKNSFISQLTQIDIDDEKPISTSVDSYDLLTLAYRIVEARQSQCENNY
jgi:predicted transcriptional regulator